MKITVQQLRRIIKEEVSKILLEHEAGAVFRDNDGKLYHQDDEGNVTPYKDAAGEFDDLKVGDDPRTLVSPEAGTASGTPYGGIDKPQVKTRFPSRFAGVTYRKGESGEWKNRPRRGRY